MGTFQRGNRVRNVVADDHRRGRVGAVVDTMPVLSDTPFAHTLYVVEYDNGRKRHEVAEHLELVRRGDGR